MSLQLTYTTGTDGDGQPTGVVTFTVTQAPAYALSADVDPGDGGQHVNVTLNSGTGTGQHTYTTAGVHTYTATATAAREHTLDTLADLDAAYPTLADLAAHWDTLRDLYAESLPTETATALVVVTVPGAVLTATAEYDAQLPYVLVTAWLSDPQTVTGWTLSRTDDQSTTVLAAGTTITSGQTWEDTEARFGVPLVYVLETVRSGTRQRYRAVAVWLEGPGACWLSDPITGAAIPVQVQSWPERDWAARQSVMAVLGRADPVVRSDVHTWPSGTITFVTRTQAELNNLYTVLKASHTVQLRPEQGCAIQPIYAAVGDIGEQRLTSVCEDWRRLVAVAIQEIATIPYVARPPRATLQDIADAYPAPNTLQDIAMDNGTLLELAARRWPR